MVLTLQFAWATGEKLHEIGTEMTCKRWFLIGVTLVVGWLGLLASVDAQSPYAAPPVAVDVNGNPIPPSNPNWPPPSGASGSALKPMPGPAPVDPLYQNAAASAYNASIRPPAASPIEKLIQSTWYTRVDYFHWNERIDSFDFVNESGALYTLGYVRRVGSERFRGELFGGNMNYEGFGQFEDDDGGWLEPLDSTTRYLGLRGEYEYLIQPQWTDDVSFFLGIGSRFWFRDIRSGVTIFGNPVWGYQETWWTIYPYLGIETKRPLRNGLEIYTSTRVGATPLTYERPSIIDGALYPRCGVLGQAEIGLRGQCVSAAAYFEGMTWSHSSISDGWFQPDSRMYTIGGRLGFSF